MKKNIEEVPQIKPASVLEPKSASFDVPEIRTEETRAPLEMNIENMPRKRNKKIPKILFTFIGVLLVIFLILVVAIGLPLRGVYAEALVLQTKAQAVKSSVASQDISVIKTSLQSFQTELSVFQKKYGALAWTKVIPVVGAYYRDGEAGLKAGVSGLDAGQLLLTTVEPYADIIGFKGGSSAKSGLENANNRLEFIVQTVKDIAPKMGEISAKAAEAETALKTIDPSKYPATFRGIKVREQLTSLLTLAEQATDMISRSKPLVDEAPYLLGVDQPRTYLMIFQNDNELRPAGGFLSAYTIVKISKGKFTPVSSSDIYSLDAKYTPQIPGPDIFPQYLAGIYVGNNKLRLRDMNWSPDLKASMDMFLPEAKKAGLAGFDGVIVIDTKVLGNILDVIGTIGVPGFGNFGTGIEPKCNCPGYLYQIESYTSEEGPVVWSQDEPGKIIFAPKNYGKNRKDILGVLMNSVLANTLGQSKDRIPKLFQAGWNSIMGKHLMMYMYDPAAQKAIETFNIAGRVQDFNGDYLNINNANLGGRKSNLYVQEEVAQTYTRMGDGSIQKLVEITYKNPQKDDGFLNVVLPTWTRIYVPKGSTLVKADGFETPGTTTEELGKTVFSGGFKLRPLGAKTISVTYKLPFKASGNLQLLIQKQSGIPDFLYTIKSGRQSQEIDLGQDTIVNVNL